MVVHEEMRSATYRRKDEEVGECSVVRHLLRLAAGGDQHSAHLAVGSSPGHLESRFHEGCLVGSEEHPGEAMYLGDVVLH